MDTTNFKNFQVVAVKARASDNLFIYGLHDKLEDALLDQLNRAYKYNQKTIVYALEFNNNIVRLGEMHA